MLAYMLTSFHHVAIIASDYERSKHFYTAILGFTIDAENYRQDRDSFKLDLAGPGGMRIELFSFPNAPARLTRPEACGLRHLAFSVLNLDQAMRRLREHGVKPEGVRTDEYTGRRFTFFADPDGLPLELYEC